ncbi:MAG: DUF362 domain-containing protein, partial [Planctomycetes bacterium]|nr:DUF362 domain-containing protein [Planctomycetota bacterium]
MKRVIVRTCPKTGRQFHVEQPSRRMGVPPMSTTGVSPVKAEQRWFRDIWTGGPYYLLLPLTGLFALVWFLLRVLPKPSRAAYPCQRMAAPLASAFVVWVLGLMGSAWACRRAQYLRDRSRYVLATLCAVAAVVILWGAISATENNPATAAFAPSEPVNSPMGMAQGIHPGRVVWVHDPDATSWDGSTGHWWDDKNTDAKVVEKMVSSALTGLTGRSSDAQAWDALFRHFNKTRGFGDAGYQKPEKIAIKINMNQDRGRELKPGTAIPSPQVVYSVVRQLIKAAGVPGSAITVYDATRYISDPIYDRIKSDPDPELKAVTFVVAPTSVKDGRIGAAHDTAHPLKTVAGTVYLPTCVTEAKYMINLALMRAHTLCGITLCAKNHFGTTYFEKNGWTPSPLHDSSSRQNPMGSYNCLVDLNGHKQIDGKTLLYMIDGLYAAKNQGAPVLRFASFGNDWFSSILASQDMVAIDSVGLDFLRHEQTVNPNMVDVTGNPDNYLHEAALANQPPSGTKYDPEEDGIPL